LRKYPLILFLLFGICSFNAQINKPSFFDIQKEVQKEFDLFNSSSKLVLDSTAFRDTVKMKLFTEERKNAYETFALKKNKLTDQLNGVPYPDFYFEDFNDKAYSLSDFLNKKIVLNFNYAFCYKCIQQIDSLIYFAGKKTKIIVLLHDRKSDASDIYEKFGDKILLGFISPDYSAYYGLQSQTCTLLLDENRNVKFFCQQMFRGNSENELYKQLKLF